MSSEKVCGVIGSFSVLGHGVSVAFKFLKIIGFRSIFLITLLSMHTHAQGRLFMLAKISGLLNMVSGLTSTGNDTIYIYFH